MRPLTSLTSFLLLAAVLLLFVKPVLVGLVTDGTWLAEPRVALARLIHGRAVVCTSRPSPQAHEAAKSARLGLWRGGAAAQRQITPRRSVNE